MRITIDNEDGRGAVDYTAAIAVEGPITVQRQLNQPSRCTAEVLVGAGGLAMPARRGRVVVSSHAGTILFTGYLVTEPVQVYAGTGVTGPVYRARISAVSDEWLLDKQGSGGSAVVDGLSLSLDGASLLSQLATTAQAGGTTSLTVAGEVSNPRAIGAFAVEPAASWSTNAGAAAGASYAAYRALNGTISFQSAGSVTHALSDADGTLDVSELSTSNVRELANDVTLSGAEEPTVYVQEIFQGDGTTTAFGLTDAVFRGTNRTLLKDSFTEATFDTSQWSVGSTGGHLTLGSAGLTMNGGNGYDGETLLTGLDAIEMGGFVLAELGGVQFGASSDGTLAGFYSGQAVLANCFAGFRVRQSVSTTGGVTVLVPVVNGAEVGTVYTPVAGHSYTLRLRLYCAEMLRIPQVFYCMVDGVVQEFGGDGAVAAGMQVVFELVDEGVSSNTPATVLYDTATTGAPVANTPGTCVFTAVNAMSMYGSVASVEVTRPGSLWAVSTLPNGTQETRLVGSAGQGVDCEATYGTTAGSPGKVTFFAGRVPVAGERVTVSYRTEERAVARLADAASVAAEAAAGAGVAVPGLSRWLGKVTQPVARSSADCENAASAVLAMGTARSAALAGSYAMDNPAQDVWPGDVLAVTSAGVTTSLLVRSVLATDGHAVPELTHYKIAFANDWATEWADGLGLKLSTAIASDAYLPPAAATGPAEVLANLPQLTVLSLTETAMQVSAGCTAPTGGGFEVRRRDWNFGVGVDTPDLVLRSPVESFSIPRAAQVERFYIRMYDASTPPLYSRWSSALFVNAPVS